MVCLECGFCSYVSMFLNFLRPEVCVCNSTCWVNRGLPPVSFLLFSLVLLVVLSNPHHSVLSCGCAKEEK